MAKDAFCGVLAFSGIVVDFYLHRADFQAFATFDALALVAMDAKEGEVTHRLEEDRDGADVFAEGAIILEHDGKEDSYYVINHVADKEEHEHGVLGGFAVMEQQEDENERQCKHDVTDKAKFLSRALRLLVGKQVEYHGRPASVAAPAATEEQGSEDFGDGIMQHASAYHP